MLDEKDEKIEILSKMHSYSPRSISSRRPSSIHSNQEQGQVQGPVDQEKDIRFKLQQTPYLIYGDNTDLYFVGNSSSRAFFSMSNLPIARSDVDDTQLLSGVNSKRVAKGTATSTSMHSAHNHRSLPYPHSCPRTKAHSGRHLHVCILIRWSTFFFKNGRRCFLYYIDSPSSLSTSNMWQTRATSRTRSHWRS